MRSFAYGSPVCCYGLSASHKRGMFYAHTGRLQRFELFRRFHGISALRSAFDDYALTGSLLQALELHESSHKACPPSTRVTCLGVLFDTINFTMSVTPDRLLELQTDLLPKWLTKKSATKTELQSLIGKLAFVSKCV